MLEHALWERDKQQAVKTEVFTACCFVPAARRGMFRADEKYITLNPLFKIPMHLPRCCRIFCTVQERHRRELR